MICRLYSYRVRTSWTGFPLAKLTQLVGVLTEIRERAVA